jgi:branched-chain amino acid transport system permease protein
VTAASGVMTTYRQPSWRGVARVGLMGAAISLYICLVGIVPTFHQRPLVAGVISLGQTALILTLVVTGYVAARRAGRRPAMVVGAGALAGLLVGVALLLLVLLGSVFSLRPPLFHATDALYNVLTLDTYTDGLAGIWIPAAGGALLGALGGLIVTLPLPVQRGLAAAVLSVVILGLFAGLLRTPMLGSSLAGLGRTLFAPNGLTIHGALVTLSGALGVGIGAAIGGRLGGVTLATIGGVLGGVVLALAGGAVAREAGAAIGGALGIAGGAVAGAIIEREVLRVRLAERFATMPAYQRRLAVSPLVLGGFLLVLALPLAAGNFFANVVALVALYILMGLGLNITLGLAGLLDLGFVAFFAVGAYTVGLMTSLGTYGLLDLPSIGIFGITLSPFWFALPFAALFAFFFGIFLGLPILGIRGDYLAIATLGFGEIIRILAGSNLLLPLIGGPRGVVNIPQPITVPPGDPLGGPVQIYYIALVLAAIVAFVAYRLRDSRLGRAWIAIREDEDVAEALGVNLVHTKLLAYALGAAFAGLGGAVFAGLTSAIFPGSINLFVSINVAALIIVGGMGSIPGVVVGAIVLIGLPELFREVSEYRFLFYGMALILMMRLRPEGLIPSRTAERELHVEAENVEAAGAVMGASVAAREAALDVSEER